MQVRSYFPLFPNASLDGKFSDLGGRGLAKPQRFFHRLRGVREAGRRIVESFLMRGAICSSGLNQKHTLPAP
jgi:hypothetical protein